jgi:rubrerythrin
MTREEAKSYLMAISHILDSMAIEYLTEKDGEKMREAITSLEQEPCEDKRLYIKVFADLEPDDIAEKIYQICDEDKFPKVIESLKEYFDSEPCEDCVSREAVKDILHKSNQKAVITFEDFEELVNKLPSVNPHESKTGRWIAVENEEMKTVGYYCSKCDLPMETEYRTKLCPNCGANMESEGKE